jgi:hypothetical protein
MKIACSSYPLRRRRGSALGAALLGLSLLAAPSAHAQQPSKEELAKARAAFGEGVALAAANNCAAALVKYKEVAQVKLTAQVAFNIAECEARLGKLVQSLGNYRLAVSMAGEDKNLKKLLVEAGGRVEDIEARIPKLTIKRGEGIETASILLDGTELGQSQLGTPIPVDPGAHVVVGRFQGKEYFHENVTVAEKANRTFTVQFELPKAKVEQVPADQTPDQPPPPPPKSRVPGIVVTAIGGAALITGFAAIGVRQSAASTLSSACNDKNQCFDTPEAHDAASKGKTMTGLAEIMVPVGVVGVAVGIALIATAGPQKAKPADQKDEKKESASSRFQVIASAPGATIGGVSVLGRF